MKNTDHTDNLIMLFGSLIMFELNGYIFWAALATMMALIVIVSSLQSLMNNYTEKRK